MSSAKNRLLTLLLPQSIPLLTGTEPSCQLRRVATAGGRQHGASERHEQRGQHEPGHRDRDGVRSGGHHRSSGTHNTVTETTSVNNYNLLSTAQPGQQSDGLLREPGGRPAPVRGVGGEHGDHRERGHVNCVTYGRRDKTPYCHKQ